jgi:hypothetical protein
LGFGFAGITFLSLLSKPKCPVCQNKIDRGNTYLSNLQNSIVVGYEIIDFSFLKIKKITSKDTARINLFVSAIILLLLNLGFKFHIYNNEVSLTSIAGQAFMFYVFINLISVVIYLSKKNINTPETKSILCAICRAIMVSSSLKVHLDILTQTLIKRSNNSAMYLYLTEPI